MTNMNFTRKIIFIVAIGLIGGLFLGGMIRELASRPKYEYGIYIINDSTVSIHSIHRDTTYECTFEEIPIVLEKDNL